MSEQQQMTPDPSGIERTETGEIQDQKLGLETTKETPPTETKAEPEVKAEEKKEEPKSEGKKSVLNEKEPEGAPEKYEAFKVPEGFELDEAVATEFGALAKKNNLSQAQAQELIDFHVAKTQEAHEAPFKVWQEQQEAWANEIKSDPELGKKLPEVKATFSKMLDTHLEPKVATAFREAMDFTGAGNNPDFIRAMYALAQKFTEGSHVSGRNPSELGQKRPGDVPATAGKALYPNLP